ncbi:hypothetical protein [Sphingomonas sp. LM7]|uniref:hypothetical protein n=1 Tax=Sphingomonas sp. LM7 TaxID=1938607 RepID=UPI0012377917|nr:hypothetical protein [Sphingomonas sp. LM7]
MTRQIISEYQQRDYYTRRLEQSRSLAIAATSPSVRAIHAEMAAGYEVLARNAMRDALPIWSSLSRQPLAYLAMGEP